MPRKYVPPTALMTAAEVRKSENLPADGRGAARDFARLEKAFRDVLAPSVPSYDVASVQGADFSEWAYGEGFGCYLARTQSIEINARLALAAAAWEGEISADIANAVRSGLRDKWSLEPADPEPGVKVWFPPGGNLGWIVNTDNVLRAFDLDASWRLKPHPVTTEADLREAVRAFGVDRVYDPGVSGLALLRAADAVGSTTTSEMGIIATAAGHAGGGFHALRGRIRRWLLSRLSGVAPESGSRPGRGRESLGELPLVGGRPAGDADSPGPQAVHGVSGKEPRAAGALRAADAACPEATGRRPVMSKQEQMEGFGRVLRGETTLPEFVQDVLDRPGEGAAPVKDWADRLPAEYVRYLLDSGRLDAVAAMALAVFAVDLVKESEARTTA